MDLTREDITSIFDGFVDTEVSVEELMIATDVNIGGHDDSVRLRMAMTEYMANHNKPTQGSPGALQSKPEPITFIDGMINESTLIVDQELILGVFACDGVVMCKFIRQLDAIPTDGIVNVIIELNSMSDINYFILDAGVMISNLIRKARGTKIFNFGGQAAIADLMFAMCCDEVYVGELASISITKADNGSHISRYIIPVYEYLVKSTYDYWVNRGLFTREEVDGLFKSEHENSIQLLSEEISARLKQPHKG